MFRRVSRGLRASLFRLIGRIPVKTQAVATRASPSRGRNSSEVQYIQPSPCHRTRLRRTNSRSAYRSERASQARFSSVDARETSSAKPPGRSARRSLQREDSRDFGPWSGAAAYGCPTPVTLVTASGPASRPRKAQVPEDSTSRFSRSLRGPVGETAFDETSEQT